MKKSKFEVRSYQYVRRSHLCEIADNADRWNYNRQLDSKAVRTLPKSRRIAYPVIQSFLHEHRNGEPCEIHMRLVIHLPKGIATADVPLNYFDKLPKAYTAYSGGRNLLLVLLDEKGVPSELRFGGNSPDLDRAAAYFVEHCPDPQVKKFVQAHLVTAA